MSTTDTAHRGGAHRGRYVIMHQGGHRGLGWITTRAHAVCYFKQYGTPSDVLIGPTGRLVATMHPRGWQVRDVRP